MLRKAEKTNQRRDRPKDGWTERKRDFYVLSDVHGILNQQTNASSNIQPDKENIFSDETPKCHWVKNCRKSVPLSLKL